MVFQEASQLVLVIEPRQEMLTHRTGVMLAQAIVEALVVGVVEALLLECPFEVPVNLDAPHEIVDQARRSTNTLGRHRPEERRTLAPGAFEDFGQDQHRHIAADAVALAGDLDEFADHRLLRGRGGVVELQRVGPAGEIGITAIGEEHVAGLAFDPDVVLRRAGQIEFTAADEVLRMGFDPGMPEAHVVGNEIEHEFEASFLQAFTQPGEGGVATQILMHRITGDRKAGAGDIILLQVGQGFVKLAPPFGIAA